MSTQKDNQTFREKKALRKAVLTELATLYDIPVPVVIETHGGRGELWKACYPTLERGCVFEKDPVKAARLGKQRPTWAVYEADVVPALEGGAGAHLTADLLDVDPYGGCWDTIGAFFRSARPFAPVMAVVVNDGLRHSLSLQRGWATEALAGAVARHGNDLFPIYLEVCEELMAEKAAYAGYRIDRFSAYHCGDKQFMTHFRAILVMD
jgi:hypothetical protein